MAYDLNEINRRAQSDPEAFIRDCDEAFNSQIKSAADLITSNCDKSPIVLISGPSGSGKTTTAKKIADELHSRGVTSYSLQMDNYFKPVDKNSPLTEDGELDFESPHCIDMDLLTEHFTRLRRGELIEVPKYSFHKKSRESSPSARIRLNKGDIVIAEGIHALNDELTGANPNALKLYISARSNIVKDGEICFKGTWMRLVRRTLRDNMFRGAGADVTLGMWANVRRGEKLNISPFKDKADMKIDSSFPYEVSVMKDLACEVFRDVPDGIERHEELQSILPALKLFESIDPKLLLPDSLLCEFVGGGKYEY